MWISKKILRVLISPRPKKSPAPILFGRTLLYVWISPQKIPPCFRKIISLPPGSLQKNPPFASQKSYLSVCSLKKIVSPFFFSHIYIYQPPSKNTPNLLEENPLSFHIFFPFVTDSLMEIIYVLSF